MEPSSTSHGQQSFIDALCVEIDRLEAELSQDLRYLRLVQLRETLSAYRSDGSQGRRARGTVPPGRRRSAASSAALDAVLTCLTVAGGGPVTTRDLYAYVQDLGIPVGGAEPLNSLSAMMSNSGLFAADRRAGWTIRSTAPQPDGEDYDQ